MSTRKLLGVKMAFIVSKIEKIRSLNYRIPKGLLRHVAGKLYLFTLKQDVRFLKTRVKAGYPLQRNRQRFSPVYLHRVCGVF
jgi:hypothetical protein